MAKIALSDEAPREAVKFSLANAEPFELSGTKTYETDDRDILANAEAHPWLTVDYPEVEVVSGSFVDHLRPEDDPLSRFNSVANDPEAAKAAEEAKVADRGGLVAIEAGLPQTEVHKEGDVAETLAADPTSKTSSKSTKKDS